MTLPGMRLVLLAMMLSVPAAAAADPWTDLAACSKAGKHISITATRTKTGTQAGMRIWGLGVRGPTPEERCLGAAVAKLVLPPLPSEVVEVTFGYVIGEPPVVLGGWPVIDAAQRAALAACDRKPRTVRLVIDRRARKTRVWLPAWQFHSPTGDGSTPPAQRVVKACLTKAIRGWSFALPPAVGELQLAIK